jgi:ABC-type uncharacterized transport system substrate-binding protein
LKKILLYFILTISLFAHPHTFIDVYPTINFIDGSSKKINFIWKIDEMTSTILIMDIDTDGDGKISSRENRFIRDNYFTVFEDFNYYTHIKIEGKKIPFPQVKNFKATIENHQICYSFDIEGDFKINNTTLEFGDSDFYIAMILKDKFIKVNGAKAIATGVDNDFYYGYKLEFK